jgi:Heavy-metal resistance
MTRARKLSIIIPSLIGGVVLFASTFGRADDGRTVAAFWPAADVTVRPAPPPPPRTPPPGDPWGGGSHTSHHRSTHKHGISVTIHDGKVQIEGVHDMVAGQIEAVREMLRNNPSIPKDVRDRVMSRLDRVNGIIDRRLGNLRATDIDQLGDQMSQMGDEIEKAMEGINEDLAKLGDQWGKDFADKFSKDWQKSFKKFNFGPDKLKFNFKDKDNDNDNDNDSGNSDDDNDPSAVVTPPTPPTPPTPGTMDSDDPALRTAIADLGNLSLSRDQREQLRHLRIETDAKVEAARNAINQLSDNLSTALENPSVTDQEIDTFVNEISKQEAQLRKARILAWVKARRALDDDQRARVVKAAAKAKHHH